MLPCLLWLAWSVPSRVKLRRAVNWASMFRHEELVGVQAIPTLLAAAQSATWRHRLVVRDGE